MDDLFYMKKAYGLAKRAERINEVPVGAVIVKDGKIIWKNAVDEISVNSDHIGIKRGET